MLCYGLFASAILISIISHPSWAANTTSTAKALYFIDNHASNSVHALTVGPDGLVSNGSITPTGEKGASMVSAGTNTPAYLTPLDSTGCVQVYQDVCKVDSSLKGIKLILLMIQFLFAVNTISNTVSMFRINPESPTELTLIGSFDTQGDFPTSMDISPILNQVCVGNTGTRSGITCFKISQEGLRLASSPIYFSLNQTVPASALAPGPIGLEDLALLSSISFNSNSTALLATVNGIPKTGFRGYLAIYPVINGVVTDAPKFNTPVATNFLFSTVNIPGTTKVLASDALIGATIIDTAFPGTHSSTSEIIIPILGQIAVCWTVYSDYTKTAFFADAAVNQIVEIDPYAPRTDVVVQFVRPTNGQPGNLDLVAVGSKIYALSPGRANGTAAMVVLDASGGKGTAHVVQTFQIPGSSNGTLALSEGLAWY